ncbi:MAG TPA: HEPN domain-containing protein [Solirubrobacteraceae bacterium]|nr:HEPN domain-containing protein [Solirubrobacteraceae bacterium]
MSPRSDELLQFAHERLAAARDLLATAHPEAAVSMAYYAGLYAARAALSEHDLNARSHRGLWQLMREHVVGEGRIAGEVVQPLQQAQGLREAVDYDAQRIGEEEANALLTAAERLVEAVGEAYGGR